MRSEIPDPNGQADIHGYDGLFSYCDAAACASAIEYVEV